MNHQFPTLFSPCRIGNVEIKNRICKAPQTTGLSHMDGTVSSRLVRCYEDLAKGEVGMIIVEYAFVDRDCSKSASNQLGMTMSISWALDGWQIPLKIMTACPAFRLSTAADSGFWGRP